MSEGGRRFGGRSLAKPVKEGEEYELDIKEVSRRGDGVGRIQGFVIFVPGTRPGSHVKVKITRVAPTFATAEVVG